MQRKYRIVLAAVVALAFIGYRYWQRQQAAPVAETQAAVADTPNNKSYEAAAGEALRSYGSLKFKPCSLSTPMVRDGVTAQCTTLSVSENPAAPQGRKIDLNIAWVPAEDDAELSPDPVFFIAGGPGQSAVETFPQVAPAFAKIFAKRHVILVDQRGTGKSNALKCESKKEDEDLTEVEGAALISQRTRECLDDLSKHADVTQYDTTTALGDLDAVRKALGVEKINLVGVSYGTRVAQQYAMRYPQHTRTIVLDSVVPNTTILGNIWAKNLESALDQQFALCTKNAECTKAIGNPREDLNAVLGKLRQGPVAVTWRDPLTGESKDGTLSAAEVSGMVRMFSYMPMMASLVPHQLHEAAQGRYGTLKAMVEMLKGGMKDSMMMGMQLSVFCTEDAEGLVSDAADKDTVLGTSLTDSMAEMCKVWPKGKMPADFHKPLATDVPALILEGELDPVTPPKYGEETVKSLKNGRLLVLRGQGHNVIGAGCMPRVFAKFIETADAKSLDAKCLDTLTYTQPFTSFNGWTP